jgi:hypothetical protein
VRKYWCSNGLSLVLVHAKACPFSLTVRFADWDSCFPGWFFACWPVVFLLAGLQPQAATKNPVNIAHEQQQGNSTLHFSQKHGDLYKSYQM